MLKVRIDMFILFICNLLLLLKFKTTFRIMNLEERKKRRRRRRWSYYVILGHRKSICCKIFL